MPDIDTAKLENLLKTVVENMNFRLYAFNFNTVARTLRVFIDRATNGVTVDDCRRVSIALSHGLDDIDLIRFPYTLEVSSPGIDRPLLRPEHYQWALGKIAELDLGTDRIKGHIRNVDNDGVTIATSGGEKYFAFAVIKRAKVMEEPYDDE